MITPFFLTPSIRASTLTPCPKCGAERLQIKQWLTLDEYRAHRAGDTVAYHHSLYCPCGWDERGIVAGPTTVKTLTRKEQLDHEWEDMKKSDKL